MGFAAGVRAGTSLVDSILQEKRASEEFGWKRDDRTREEGIRTKEDAIRDANLALFNDPPVPGAAAAPAVAKAQGDAGVRAGTAEGISTKPAGAPQPDVPVTAATAPDAIAGTATAPTPAVQATPAAGPQGGPKLGRDELIQRNLQQAALLRGNSAGYNTARQGERTAGVQNILDTSVQEFMALPPAEREKRAFSPNLTGDIPLVTLSTDKNGMTVIPIDPKTGRPGAGEPIKLSWADAAQLHAAEQMAARGFGAEAIDVATKVNSRIGDVIKSNNALAGDVAKTNNDAAYKGGSLAEQGRHNRATESQAASNASATANYYKTAGAKEFLDEKGNVVMVSPQADRQGNVKWQRSDGKPTMEGLRMKPTGTGGTDEFKPVQAEGTIVGNKKGDRRVVGSEGENFQLGAPTNAKAFEKVLTDAGLPQAETKNIVRLSDGVTAAYPIPGVPRDQWPVFDIRNPEDLKGIVQEYRTRTEVVPGVQAGFAKFGLDGATPEQKANAYRAKQIELRKQQAQRASNMASP